MNTVDLVQKSRGGEMLSRNELVYLLNLPVDGEDTYRVMAEAARVSKEVSGGRAEVHAQFAVNLAPCPCDCLFCSFAKTNKVFTSATEVTPEQAVAHARQFEKDGANAVYMMTTATYPFERFIEMGKEVRAHLKPETILIAMWGIRRPKLRSSSGMRGLPGCITPFDCGKARIPVFLRKNANRASVIFRRPVWWWAPAWNRWDRSISMKSWPI